MVHLVMHVMATKGISISLPKHELENHDGHHQEPHLAEEMTQSECDLVSSGSMSRHQKLDASMWSSCHKEVCTIYQIDVGHI